MGRKIIIIEGADASGKSTLCNKIKKQVNGKCHVFHSNYSKSLPQQNHWRQHKVFVKIADMLFNKKNYTGNSTIIFDRSYISDIVYGFACGYGSKGTVKSKFKKLTKLFDRLLDIALDIEIYIIYCNPSKKTFIQGDKELLTSEEDDTVTNVYKGFFNSESFFNYVSAKTRIHYYEYDYQKEVRKQNQAKNRNRKRSKNKSKTSTATVKK